MRGMPQRDLFLAAYDVTDDARLRLALKCTKEFAVGGQKSAYEVYLTPAERRDFIAAMESVLELAEDRFALIRIEPRSKVYCLGKAVKPADPSFFYVG
jgi:CRISPR-associated protein Cas2